MCLRDGANASATRQPTPPRMTATQAESVPPRFPLERLSSRSHRWPRRACRPGSILFGAHPEGSNGRAMSRMPVKPLAAPRLSAVVSVCGKRPAFTVKASLTRLSVALGFAPQGGSPRRGLPEYSTVPEALSYERTDTKSSFRSACIEEDPYIRASRGCRAIAATAPAEQAFQKTSCPALGCCSEKL